MSAKGAISSCQIAPWKFLKSSEARLYFYLSWEVWETRPHQPGSNWHLLIIRSTTRKGLGLMGAIHSKKWVHFLRWTTFPGRTGWNFGWMDRALCNIRPLLCISLNNKLKCLFKKSSDKCNDVAGYSDVAPIWEYHGNFKIAITFSALHFL